MMNRQLCASNSLVRFPLAEGGVDAVRLRRADPAVAGGRKEAVLIDAALDDRQVLAAGARDGMAVAEFGGSEDGLAQLLGWAAMAKGYDALHLLCHGASGRLMLGARELNRAALADPQVQDALAAIGQSLRADGAVLLYSCNVAQGTEGAAFVAELALAFARPVAASAKLIGAAELGGGWVLEHATGAISAAALAWPEYGGTLTIASTTTTFSGVPVGSNVDYQSLAPGFLPLPATLTWADVATSGWDVTAQSSNNTNAFAIRGIGFGANGDGDSNALRFQSSDVDYVIFKSNVNGFYFDLTQFSLRNGADASLTIQALDASGALTGSAVPFNILGGVYFPISLAGNADFVAIYGFKITFSSTIDAPFFDNLIVANIGIPAVPTTTVATAALSVDSGSSGSDFITNIAAQTISGTLSANLAAGESVQVSYDNGSSWSNATTYAAGSSAWSTTTTLAGSSTFQARVTNTFGSSTAYTHSYTLDTTAPAAPSTPDLISGSDSGSSNTDNITSTTTPTFTGTAESGSTVTLYDSNGTTILGTAVATGGTWSINSSALTPGSHNLTVKTADAAGNVSSSSSALTVTVDTTAPSSVALSANTVTTAGAGSGAAIATLSATDTQAVTYALAAGSGGNDAANGSFAIVGNALTVGGSALGAGTYNIYLSATDAAGNVSYLAQTITVQSIPAVASIVRAGGASGTLPASTTSAIYTVTFNESVTNVDINDFTLTATGTASGTIASITGSGDTYTITVNSVAGDGTLRLDLNGSGTGIQSSSGGVAIAAGYTSGHTYTLDHTAPAAPSTPDLIAGSDSGSSNSDNITSTTTPTFTGTAESGSTVTLYDSNGTTILGTAVATGGTWSINSSALSQGSHNLTVKTADAAGNVSPASSALAVTIDTTAPSSVALSTTNVATNSATSGAAVATLSATDTQAVTYALVAGSGGNDADNGSFAIAGNALNVGGSALSAGTYNIYLSATDAAGNVSYLAQTITVQNAPAVTSIVRAGGAGSGLPASATSAVYTVTFSESVSNVDLSDFTLTTTGTASGTIASITGSGDTYTITVTGVAGDGTLRLDLNGSGTGIQNGALVAIIGGHTSGQSFTLDHTAPATLAAPAMTSGTDTGGSNSDAITSNTMPIFTGTGEANATVRLYDTDGTTVLGTTVADGSGNWSITSSVLTAGSYTLSVRQTDAAGNVSAAGAGLAVVIDTSAAAPATPTLAAASDSGAIGDRVTNVTTPTVTGTAEANATVTLYDTDGTTVLGTATANGSGVWSIVTSTLGAGFHTLTAKQTDRAGNISAASPGLGVTIDTQAPAAPAAPVLAVGSDSGTLGDNITNFTSPVISGTAAPNASVTLYDSNGTTVLGTATADGAGNWSVTSSALAAGVHTLTVKQADLAGNVSTASVPLSLTIEAPPAPPPPTTPPPTTIDGVEVIQQPVVLPGGGAGTQVVIPVVTPGRNESTGSTGVADIPLSSAGGTNLLVAQLPAGFGLTATGGVSRSATSSLNELIQSIKAATPSHPVNDQSHLTGNGVEFLGRLAGSMPLLVETIVPTAGATAPTGPLTLTGTSTAEQRTALVIDASQLPSGSQIVLNAVDFAAIVGSVSVTGNTSGQIFSGDAASQTFTVSSSTGSTIFSGGGSDVLVFGSTLSSPAAAARTEAAPLAANTSILHGGLDGDTATFDGARSAYTIEYHDGHMFVASKAQPGQKALVVNVETLKFADQTLTVEHRSSLSAIAGLYQDILDRQADYTGIDFWGTADKNGMSLGDIALKMITSAEAQGKQLGAFNGNTAHDVELLYQSILGRHSDAQGLVFWTDAMARGLSLSQVAHSFVISAEFEVHKIAANHWDFFV